MFYVLTCYRREFAVFDDYRTAKAVLARHIWADMPWARPIEWHLVDLGNDEPDLDQRSLHAWVTASHGEWLNHRIEEFAHRPEVERWPSLLTCWPEGDPFARAEAAGWTHRP